MPGLDKSRVVGISDEDLDEFTCAICLALFVCPEVTQCCRQTYCKDCIREWVSQHKTCPNDRKTLTKRGLRPVPRAMTNFLHNIKIKCDYEWDGCTQVVRIGDLCQHRIVCDFRPNQLCKTCGSNQETVLSHNCIESLKLEKEKTDVENLNLLDEKSLLLNERQENIAIISALKAELADIRNSQQMAINRIKKENSIALDQLVKMYERESEAEKENNKMIINQMKSELLRASDELEKSYSRALKMERETNQKNLESVKHALKSEQEAVSKLEWRLFTSERNYLSAIDDNEELKLELILTENLQKELTEAKINHQMTIDRIIKEQLIALDQLAKMYERESEAEKENHQIALENVEKSLIKEEKAVFDLELELNTSKRNFNTAKEDISTLNRQLLTVIYNNNLLIILILSLFALYLGLTIYVVRTI